MSAQSQDHVTAAQADRQHSAQGQDAAKYGTEASSWAGCEDFVPFEPCEQTFAGHVTDEIAAGQPPEWFI